MRIFKIFLLIACLIVFSEPRFSQTAPENAAHAKIFKIKTDVLLEMETMSSKDQAYYYSELGEIYFELNPKDGLRFISKSVALALDPVTVYKDEAEKLSAWRDILDYMWDEDPVSANAILAKMRQLKIDESNQTVSARASKIYIRIADELFLRKYDEKMVLEFAALSLKGKQPAVDEGAAKFFRNLKFDNEKLANLYLGKLLESLKTRADRDLIAAFINTFLPVNASIFPVKDSPSKFSESQMRESLELLLPFIQADNEALSLGQTNNCGSILYWGVEFIDDYKRLLPEKSTIVEQAISVCQKSGIENWKKPDFQKKPRRTSQDWLNLAKEINDERVRANYLRQAALKARDENDYRLAVDILDSIERDFRNSYWTFLKIDSTSRLMEALFSAENNNEINDLLENMPPEYAPFVILKFLNSIRKPQPAQQDFILNLMKTARAGFNGIDRLTGNSADRLTDPTIFAQLVQIYCRFGFCDEALTTHEETIKSLNRLVRSLPGEYKNTSISRGTSYSDFLSQTPRDDAILMEKYFDQIYKNLGKIENPRIRIEERLGLLRKVLRVTRTKLSRSN